MYIYTYIYIYPPRIYSPYIYICFANGYKYVLSFLQLSELRQHVVRVTREPFAFDAPTGPPKVTTKNEYCLTLTTDLSPMVMDLPNRDHT